MQNRKTSAILISLYLLPWGIQCLVTNILPIYIGELPFATESTIGLVTGIGALITMVSQLVWARIADRSKRKSRVLSASLLIVTVAALLFLAVPVRNLSVLLVLTVLFYSSYMTHQPLIDTISVEQCDRTRHPFSWFRSFASLGYGCMELLYILLLLLNDNNSLIFLYIAILALVSAVISLLVQDRKPAASSTGVTKTTEKVNLSAPFVKFLVFTFFLFISNSVISTFFPVYFTDETGLNGDTKLFTLITGAGTFLEWGIMLVLSRPISRLKPNHAFLLVAIIGILRCAVLYLAPNSYFAAFIVPFNALWFALLWSISTPYLKQLVSENTLGRAQGIYTVVAFGIAPFVGSYIGGLIAECGSMRVLFLFTALLLAVLALCAGWLFRTKTP